MKRILIGLVLSLIFINSANALVEIGPSSKDISVWSDPVHSIDIIISGVDNVYGFQFDLSYDPDLFNYSGIFVYEGTFLNRSGQDMTFCLEYDNSTPGLIDNFGCSRIGSGTVSGSGVLARIDLTLKSSATLPKTSILELSNVKISDINSQPLDNTTQSGDATVYECLQGETRTCPGGTRTCNSNNQWEACVTSGGGGGNGGNGDDIDGDFFPPPSEPEDGGDGNGEEPVYITDIVDDGCVNILDLLLVEAYFGLSSGYIGFDQRADVNGDKRVDILDLVLVALDYTEGPNCDIL